MRNNNLYGTGVALVTPFDKSGKIDFAALEQHLNRIIDGGINYLTLLGTTGEPPTMTKEEKSEILKFVKEKTAGRVPIVLGIGGNNTSAVVEEILNTDLSGIDSILSICPYYTKPSQRGIYAHFEAVAKASPLPVILYNVPGRTSKNIDPDTVIKLANDFKNIVAIKEASGNMNQIMSILAKKPEDFAVISGDDSLAVPMISLGCIGVISVAANVVPEQFSKMIKLALEGDFISAREIHFKLLELMNALFEDGSPSGAKAALNILGIMEENLRLPLVPVSPSVREKIKTLLSTLS
ncbi:MAG: 4-hydroxy-tetrahydrodipicolinate synthase [Bacteroidales bacterium]|nr:4-hydroxy-tetrahydrodipicolinate synthase [Bacteroidales bacterium]